jgi:hypothetical protein
MTLRDLRVITLLAFLFHSWGCKEPYDPSLEPGATNYLIVEGVPGLQASGRYCET